MERPLRATHHCRHYSYEGSFLDGGPRCAAGIDLSRGGSTAPCMPSPTDKAFCAKREEYTDAERSAWKAYADRRMAMIGEAVSAIPDQLPLMSEGNCPCPHCEGRLHYSRAGNGHVWLSCTTEDCVGPVHFNVSRDKPWPALKASA